MKPAISKLFAQHPVLFAQVVDDLQLTLFHPTGNRDEQKPEWIEDCRRIDLIVRHVREFVLLQHDRVLDHTGEPSSASYSLGHAVRRAAILGWLHHEYWLEKVAA